MCRLNGDIWNAPHRSSADLNHDSRVAVVCSIPGCRNYLGRKLRTNPVAAGNQSAAHDGKRSGFADYPTRVSALWFYPTGFLWPVARWRPCPDDDGK